MNAELTISMGMVGDECVIHVDWFDHNNVRHSDTVCISILDQDKPRTLQITVNGKETATCPST